MRSKSPILILMPRAFLRLVPRPMLWTSSQLPRMSTKRSLGANVETRETATSSAKEKNGDSMGF